MININHILIGIVTYNPDISRFKENIEAVRKQSNNILVVDNCSDNIKDISQLVEINNNDIIKNNKNCGIAYALVQTMDYAKNSGYKWVLTLDQDSIIQDDLLNKYIKCINDNSDDNLAILTCLIKDRNFIDKKTVYQKSEVEDIETCITSGTLMNVEKYFTTCGYDVDLFIDCVDFDICYTLLEYGYSIKRINYIGVLHEIGHGENKDFLSKNIIIFHHSPLRFYYMARNYIILHKKHKKYRFFKMLKEELLFLFKIIFYENNKIDKLLYYFKGLSAAFSY